MTRNEQNYLLNNKYEFKFLKSFKVSDSFLISYQVIRIVLLLGLVNLSLKYSFPQLSMLISKGLIFINSYLQNIIQISQTTTLLSQPLNYITNNYVFMVMNLSINFLFLFLVLTLVMKIVKLVLLSTSFKTWFQNTQPNLVPFSYFKGEELIPENRDRSEYGIRHEILSLSNLSIQIKDNYKDSNNKNRYKIQILQNNKVVKDEDLNEEQMQHYKQGFKLK